MGLLCQSVNVRVINCLHDFVRSLYIEFLSFSARKCLRKHVYIDELNERGRHPSPA